jgi:hypothetical protein
MTGPRPASPRWTPDDDRTLLKMDEAGVNKLVIARKLKRTVVAILRRKSQLRRPVQKLET